MARKVSLIVYSSRLFPAHWALWIPRKHNLAVGRRIHASGDAATGYCIEFDRNYDLESTGRAHRLVEVADVRDSFVANEDSYEGLLPQEQSPIDAIERIASSVSAPGPSLVPSTSLAPRQRVQIKNCQTWLQDVVRKLVDEGAMGEVAIESIQKAPKN